MIRVRIGVIAFDSQGRVLMVRHRKGDKSYYLFPGGGVEKGETFEECAIRECLEETGLEISLGNLLFTCESIYPSGKKHVVNFFFRAQVVGGVLAAGDEEIIDEACFVPVEDLQGMIVYPNIVQEVVDLCSGREQTGARHLGSLWE
ncbi:MAG: hypothetical protein CVV64_08725 [Candidatus Wallbacteria bacterium HGW-Wallbacteria-1]|jgi:ADP-ribose pyrophosphatase YjhB (NUDIX family)|uniref:Nudix hydrolase domain-containing protein n=1 Tax=Candidatus Wallbacteria bacterium HGW-Wallbacteria-1 TaxID=2013854 RepID=A0A2N1PQ27_9BACT|nr:MAG: hypothetical protein CVV64_08725 [Candidatus Wallbacteria bacterium HGW-Wallbacteria-1]